MKKAILAIFIATCSLAYIDVTPIEIGESPGLSSSTSFSVSNKRGNTKKGEIAVDINIKHDNNKSSAIWLFGGYKYTDAQGKSIENRGSAHLRYLHKISSSVYLETFVQNQNNRINGIKNRFVCGGGARWRIMDLKSTKRSYIGVGPIYEQIRFIEEDGNPVQKNLRVNSYFFYTAKLADSRLNAYIYYQPKTYDFLDYNLFSLAQLKTPVYKNFYLLITLKYDYDSTPPINIEKVDMEQRVSFMWKF